MLRSHFELAYLSIQQHKKLSHTRIQTPINWEKKQNYLKQLQFVLCVASTKSQDATLSGISSSDRPPDEAEYFLLRFEIRKFFRIHKVF